MRRRIAFSLFVALVILSFDPTLLSFTVRHAAMHRVMTIYPDRGWNGYPQFLEGVRAHTRGGDSIAIAVPRGGYMYAYYRASYFLTGRTVVPLFSAEGERQTENFQRAKYLALWHVRVPASVRVVWSGEGGALVERQ